MPGTSPGMTTGRASTMQDLMKGKRGLIMGIANDHSIAWGIARALAAQGAEMAFTYQGDALGKRVKPLAEELKVDTVLPCDVEDIASVDATFEALRSKWGTLDFLVHAIGFSDKNELKGRYADTTRANFSRTMVISCFSFTEVAKRAADMMPESGGSMITLTFDGSMRVMPNYNVMGVAKAALEASVRYLAVDFLGVVALFGDDLSPALEASANSHDLSLDVLQRIDPGEPRRNPLHVVVRREIARLRQSAAQHRCVDPGAPDDAHPCAGQDAYGMRMVAATRAAAWTAAAWRPPPLAKGT